MSVVSRPLTLQEFLELPEEEPALEFLDGAVTSKVSRKGRHAALQEELIEQINHSARPRKLARAFPELRATYAAASFVPDVAVNLWGRIPVGAEGELADEFWEPPDIAIEIVSPQQSVNALVRRCFWYVASGVQVALLVDPVDESIIAFRPDHQTTVWTGSDRIDVSEILPDFALTVEGLFASLRHE